MTWTVSGGRVLGPAPFFVLGIVNVTPDSFYDGGSHPDPGSALEHAALLAAQGADILDVGGESSRPYADPVSAAEETARVLPVVRGIRERGLAGPDGAPVAVSVDTYRASTALAVLDAGADIVNDISACAFDPELLDVVADRKPGYVLMHSQGRPGTMQDDPRYEDVVDEIRAFFEDGLKRLTAAGLPEERIVLDPGIGFGKLLEHNLAILRNMDRFAELGRPVLGALSNKSLFGALLGLAPGARVNATMAATAVLASRGVLLHRVHEVGAAREALAVGAALRRAD
ncbi:MAG: dihydropteroate synthase [Desulfovibrionaceae bacterium]|nr:dihydropteroate synthase [Desulfovibrionaceae bacterium]